MTDDNLFAEEEKCEHDNFADECDECLAANATVGNRWQPRKLSVDDATLDIMVQAASIPNLAAMIRRGKQQGLLSPISGYGEGV